MTVLELIDAGFTYRGAPSAALAGVNLRIEPGELVAVLGPLGSGTSTLCQLVAGLLDDRGTVSGTVKLKRTVAMLGDDPEAQPSGMTSSVDDEVQLPGRLGGLEPTDARERGIQALRMLGIDQLQNRRLETLSGGQRQLLALAGILTVRPGLLVLDQPTLSLDQPARLVLCGALRDFCAAGGAVLIVGHQFDELAEAAQSVHFLASGELSRELSDTGCDSRGVWNSLASSSTPPSRLPATQNDVVLSVRNHTVSYGSTTILDNIDLAVGRGEMVTLMGANGAGKSTLFKSLLGILSPGAHSSGGFTLHRDNHSIDLGGLRTHERARHLGWVGQDPGAQLSAATVRSELERSAPVPRHRRRDRAMVIADRESAVTSAMDLTDLAEVADVHPFDLGQARRKDVVMASAFMMAPAVMLLDEPTIGRDLAGMMRLNMFIRAFLDSGGSILATSHDQRWAAETADRIVRLEQGKLHG